MLPVHLTPTRRSSDLVDELGKTIPDKMNACRRFAAGTYTSEIGPGCGFFTLADTILHEGPKQQEETTPRPNFTGKYLRQNRSEEHTSELQSHREIVYR